MAYSIRAGSITLELLIAFSVFTLVLSSVVLMQGSVRTESFSIQTDQIAIARSVLVDARAADFLSIIDAERTEVLNGYEYGVSTLVTDLSACMKDVSVEVRREGVMRAQAVSLSLGIADVGEARLLGGDCEASAPDTWDVVSLGGTASLSGISGTAVDVLGTTGYIGLSAAPYLSATDAEGTWVFDVVLPASPNALEAVSLPDGRYVFAALNATSSQLAVIRATNTPAVVALRTPYGVDGYGSFPQGYRLFYYNELLYLVTRETAGPELHIYNVEHSEYPYEIASVELGITLNDITVREQGGSTFLFAASTHTSGELVVYDVSNPYAISPTPVAQIDLPGGQDGESVALHGNVLYLGRASTPSGPELYAYEVSNPVDSVPLLGSGEVGPFHITGIKTAGDIAFLAATPVGVANRHIEIWDIEDPSNMTRMTTRAAVGLAPRGIDYGGGSLFAVGSTTLQVFRSN